MSGPGRWVLLQHPMTGEWFVDDEQKSVNVKPAYVSVLERKHQKFLE